MIPKSYESGGFIQLKLFVGNRKYYVNIHDEVSWNRAYDLWEKHKVTLSSYNLEFVPGISPYLTKIFKRLPNGLAGFDLVKIRSNRYVYSKLIDYIGQLVYVGKCGRVLWFAKPELVNEYIVLNTSFMAINEN